MEHGNDDDDAILDKTKEVSDNSISKALSEDIHQSVLLITGKPGIGKSTSLLRVARGLIGKGTNPFLFRATEYMDVDATLEWLKAVPRTVLLFDDFADFSSNIQDLAEQCRSEGVRMLLVCADRSSRVPLVRDRIDSQYLYQEGTFWYGKLTESDVTHVINKLHSRGRLGKITRWSQDRQRGHFLESAGASLFDAMSELEGGAGFKEKLQVFTTVFRPTV